jgi:hypothetical protein
LRGNYAYPNVKQSQEKRFKLLKKNPGKWALAMARLIRLHAKRFKPTKNNPYPSFRWHDAGDLQGTWHLDAIAEIATLTKDVTLADGSICDVQYWLPTREYGIVSKWFDAGNKLPENLNVRLSAHMINGEPPIKLAKRYGLTVSTVHTSHDTYPDAQLCEAYLNGGKCGDCRTCWDNTSFHVSYPKH